LDEAILGDGERGDEEWLHAREILSLTALGEDLQKLFAGNAFAAIDPGHALVEPR
jgi:hypothetical protein